jgi:uncharacterized protein (UPF0333 family)
MKNRLRKKNIFSQKGAISIILAVLVMGMIIIITASMSALMIQQIKMSGQAGYSVVAFYAADAGAERCLYKIRKEGATSCSYVVDFASGAKYTTSYDGSSTITSKGEYRGVSRKVELNW